MNSNRREGLVAKCGLDCSICELYLCRDDKQLLDSLISQGISESDLPCPGCNENDGNCPLRGEKCDIFTCAVEREVRYCFECEDFPCEKYQPCAVSADKYLHNLKVYNLSVIKSQGIDHFLENSQSIKEKYFKCKFLVGRGSK